MRENNTLAKDTRISIVDDDASMREAINTLISCSLGIGVDEFLSAEDFLNSGHAQVCDCLILDVDAWARWAGASASTGLLPTSLYQSFLLPHMAAKSKAKDGDGSGAVAF
jgi:hypothetical protein